MSQILCSNHWKFETLLTRKIWLNLLQWEIASWISAPSFPCEHLQVAVGRLFLLNHDALQCLSVTNWREILTCRRLVYHVPQKTFGICLVARCSLLAVAVNHLWKLGSNFRNFGFAFILFVTLLMGIFAHPWCLLCSPADLRLCCSFERIIMYSCVFLCMWCTYIYVWNIQKLKS